MPEYTTPNRVKIRKVALTYASFSAAALTNTINVLSLPAKHAVLGYWLETLVSPDDGAGPMTTYQISLGDALGGGDVDSFVTATETYGAAANTIADTRGVRLTTTQGMLSTTAATNLTATATSDVNLDTATTGSWNVYVIYSQQF